jgi:hypothetical protein
LRQYYGIHLPWDAVRDRFRTIQKVFAIVACPDLEYGPGVQAQESSLRWHDLASPPDPDAESEAPQTSTLG